MKHKRNVQSKERIMKAKGFARILRFCVGAIQNGIPIKGVVLAMVLLALGGVVSLSYGATPVGVPGIQLTPSSQFQDFVPSSGELGLYLVGTWGVQRYFIADGRPTFIIQLVNPLPSELWAFVTLWGPNGEPGVCQTAHISPNGSAYFEFDNQGVKAPDGSVLYRGGMKILSTNNQGQPEIGLVGYKGYKKETQDAKSSPVDFVPMTESRLQPVPSQVLLLPVCIWAEGDICKRWVNELQKIKDLCEPVIIPRG